MNGTMTLILALVLAACDSQGLLSGDARTDPCTPETDTDGDGISDMDEGRYEDVDTDGDTLPDYLDEDSDDDTIPDAVEGGDLDHTTPPVDSDRDGTPDFRDTDSDDNGVLDEDEGALDTDGDGTRDHADIDNDDDTLADTIEIGGNPSAPVDTDGDGIPDYNDLDSDGDTISDRHEQNADTDEDGIPDRQDLDADDDGIPDEVEAGDSDIATPPVDTDGDYVPDFRDHDSDNDGLSDAWEWENGLDPTNEDSDGDGVSDLIEVGAGTDPLDATDNPRARGTIYFIVDYNEPGTPPDAMIDPYPTMDHLVFETGSSGPMEVTAVLRDDPSDEVDAVAQFVECIEPSTLGGWPDPADPSIICVGGLEVADRHAPLDGRPDTFTSVPAATAICFDIHVKPNTTVRPDDDPQVFACDVDIVGNGTVTLDTETIYFLIPAYLWDEYP